MFESFTRRAIRAVTRHLLPAVSVLEIDAAIDAPWRAGHGVGFASAYTYIGRWGEYELAGSGYIEWVDCEDR